MMSRSNSRAGRVCPVERAGSRDNRLRRWLQNPFGILSPYFREGMTALLRKTDPASTRIQGG